MWFQLSKLTADLFLCAMRPKWHVAHNSHTFCFVAKCILADSLWYNEKKVGGGRGRGGGGGVGGRIWRRKTRTLYLQILTVHFCSYLLHKDLNYVQLILTNICTVVLKIMKTWLRFLSVHSSIKKWSHMQKSHQKSPRDIAGNTEEEDLYPLKCSTAKTNY